VIFGTEVVAAVLVAELVNEQAVHLLGRSLLKPTIAEVMKIQV
jgi:hypothetical protein